MHTYHSPPNFFSRLSINLLKSIDHISEYTLRTPSLAPSLNVGANIKTFASSGSLYFLWKLLLSSLLSPCSTSHLGAPVFKYVPSYTKALSKHCSHHLESITKSSIMSESFLLTRYAISEKPFPLNSPVHVIAIV